MRICGIESLKSAAASQRRESAHFFVVELVARYSLCLGGKNSKTKVIIPLCVVVGVCRGFCNVYVPPQIISVWIEVGVFFAWVSEYCWSQFDMVA